MQKFIKQTGKKIDFQNDFKHLIEELKTHFKEGEFNYSMTEDNNDSKNYQEILHSFLTLKKKVHRMSETNWEGKIEINIKGIKELEQTITEIKRADHIIIDRTDEIVDEIKVLKFRIEGSNEENERLLKLIEDNKTWCGLKKSLIDELLRKQIKLNNTLAEMELNHRTQMEKLVKEIDELMNKINALQDRLNKIRGDLSDATNNMRD